MQESSEFEEIESRLLSDFSFSKSRIVSWLSSETLSSINLRFVRLRNTAKMNFLLAIVHLPKESLEQWRDSLTEILAIASRDADDWIQTVATILSSYVDTRRLYFCPDGLDEQLEKMVKELSVAVTSKDKGKHWDIPEYYVTQNVRRSMYHANNVDNSAAEKMYFRLRKRPKASMDRLECLQRAQLAKSQSQAVHTPETSTTYEVDQMGTAVPMSPTEKSAKTNAQVLEAKGSKAATRKEVAVKMIDLSETPQALKTKRKSTELEEKAAKRAAKEEQRKQKEKEKEVKKQQLTEKKVLERSTVDNTSTIVPETARVPAGPSQQISSAKETDRSITVPVLIVPRPTTGIEYPSSNVEQRVANPVKPLAGPIVVARSLTLNGKSAILRLSTSECKKTLLPNAPHSTSQTELTRATDEVARSGGIFDKSNCLTPANRTIINDFISGKRDENLRDKGAILLLKLDERRASEVKRDGSKHPILLETFCRLDYRNGSIGKVLKAKPIDSTSQSTV
ncbi:Negative elongation factor A [Trichuris trichiura]|uniref:Negative elongation factor A n=1 Tax=Trichuris trichiura TaxID=36087 RepID=A0A077YY26_TRITR|nr:Negative elongation factor A [Trichuris trichiura]